MIGRLGGEAGEAHAKTVLLKIDFLASGEETRGFYLRLQTSDDSVIAGPEMDVGEKRVPFAGEASVIRTPGLTRLRVVDGLAVAPHPPADFLEDAGGLLGDAAVGARADVQQIIASVSRARDQILNDSPRIFPVVVGALIAPTVVQGHAGLPSAPFFVRGNLLLGSGEIPRQLVAIVNDNVRLKLEHHLIHAFGFPSRGVERPGYVIPEDVNFSVIGE